MGPNVITVFGGSGFVGRHLVGRLTRTGATVRIAARHPAEAGPHKVASDVGQVVARRCDITDPDAVAAMVDGADWVVNLVGVFSPSAAVNDAIHHRAAGVVARAAEAAGATRLVQVSALGADENGPSAYQRSKALGEKAVLRAFPDAVVLRPSVLFGQGDGFLTRFAGLARLAPILPVFTPGWRCGAGPRFQPLWVADLAEAILAGLTRDDAKGRTYELGGPRVMSLAEVYRFVLAGTGRWRPVVPVPIGLAMPFAALTERLPGAPISRDQLKAMRADCVASGEKPGIRDLGVTPTALDAIAPKVFAPFRAGP